MTPKPRTSAERRQASPSRQSWFDRLAPTKQDLLCVLMMYLILLVLFNKIVFNDMIFSDSGDTAAHESWTTAMQHIQESEKTDPIWIPYIFSGMPISGALIFPKEVNYLQDYLVALFSKVLFFGSAMHWMLVPFLVMGCSMFFFGRMLKFSAPVALFASLVMMLNPYAVGLPETGHGSKLIVLGYIPLLFLLTYSLFEKRNLLTLGLLGATVGTMLLARHPQMAFYGLLIIGGYTLYELVLDVRHQSRSGFAKVGLIGAAIALGFTIYTYHALPTLEYAQYSIRGGGGESGAAGGLSYDYATNWSFHPFELMNLLIPSFFGYENPYYWGWMPFTNSTLYIGLIPLFLAIVAVLFRRNRFTWFLIIISAFLFLVSFGKHFSIVYDLMYNYMPYFNKLRVPVMILHVMPIILGLLAGFGLSYIVEFAQQAKEADVQRWKKGLLRFAMVIGVVLLFGLILRDGLFSLLSGFMFEKDGELLQLRQQYGAQAGQALTQFKQLRFDLFWKDFVKFALIAGVMIGSVIAFLSRKISRTTLLLALTVVTIIDLAIYDVRYINPKPASALAQRLTPDPVLNRLRQEAESTPFRVLDPSGQLDQENMLMHNLVQSVEGYSPAKLKIYQEVRDSCFRTGNRNVINMLNVKYFVSPQRLQDGSTQTVAQPNEEYLPRAWFVDSVKVASTKPEIFSILNDPAWNPRVVAVVESALPSAIGRANGADVALSRYSSREIVLKTTADSPALLVLSEVYYPAGWRAFIDGTETVIYKTNYILRSMLVPAGTHTVEMKYEPQSFAAGYSITQGAWVLVILLIGAGASRHPVVRKLFGVKSGSGKSVRLAS